MINPEEFSNWLKTKVPNGKTARTYASIVSTFLQWAGQRKICSEIFETYILWLRKNGKEPTTERLYFHAIAWLEKYANQKIINGLRPRKLIKKLPKPLTTLEVSQILGCATPDQSQFIVCRNKAMLWILYACGLRFSELMSLNMSDLEDLNRGIRILGKGGKERIVPVSEECQSHITRYLLQLPDSVSKRLWITQKGTPLSSGVARKQLTTWAERAGIQNWHPHIMRHTCATQLMTNGMNLRVLQEFLGHASISETQIYTHVTQELLQKEYEKFQPTI